MKKTIISIFSMLAVAGILFMLNVNKSEANASGPPLGATGSPFDAATCDYPGCHDTYPLKGVKPGWIASNVPVAGYIPGTTYTITAKAVYIGRNKFGFEISPQNVSGTILGTLSNISGRTQTYSGYIEHTSSSNSGTDSCVWTFKWKAPSPGVGNVTFYGAFNCANNDGSTYGDYIYTSTLVIPQNTTAGIGELANQEVSVNVFPNPATTQCSADYTLPQAANVEINLYSLDGKKVANLLPAAEQSQGEHRQLFQLPGLSSGIYLMQLINNGNSTFKKLVIQ